MCAPFHQFPPSRLIFFFTLFVFLPSTLPFLHFVGVLDDKESCFLRFTILDPLFFTFLPSPPPSRFLPQPIFSFLSPVMQTCCWCSVFPRSWLFHSHLFSSLRCCPLKAGQVCLIFLISLSPHSYYPKRLLARGTGSVRAPWQHGAVQCKEGFNPLTKDF